ncbi:hypothetical protein ACE193_09220 [Bernardetia sp. OM2101]|uniref:hypothetical protein n=1 Tax=Bernardetia sp. OM2101 TaxID=3344876 RepID=UPI0035D0D161
MIDLAEAKIIQAGHLESLSKMYKQKIVSHSLEEYSFGWAFSYNTEDSAHNPKNSLIGAQPIIINKWTGQSSDLEFHFSEMIKGITLEDKFYEKYPSFRNYDT